MKLLRKRMFPHYYWYDLSENTHKHFEAKYSDEPLIGQLWFLGEVTKYKPERDEYDDKMRT